MHHLHQSAAVWLHRQMYMMSLRQNDWNFLLTTRSSTQHRTGTLQQLTKYVDTELSEGDDDCLSFWHRNSVGLNKLYLPALRAVSVPASSSAVERVYSQGGLILRPPRARMADKLLSQLNATVRKVSVHRL